VVHGALADLTRKVGANSNLDGGAVIGKRRSQK
jgi:hypothetical protein